MKSVMGIVLLGGIFWISLLSPRPVFAQACQGDEAAADAFQKSLIELVSKVKKESLQEFQRAYHQRSGLTTLTLCYQAANDAMSCLEKAAKDPATAKEEVDADQAKREAYAKLRDKVEQDRNALKAAKAPQDAKALIGKFEL